MTTYTLFRIGPNGHEYVMGEYARRSEALRTRDDCAEQARLGRMLETYVVLGTCEEYEEWDSEEYCAECQDVRVKVGNTCSECLSALAAYFDEGGNG